MRAWTGTNKRCGLAHFRPTRNPGGTCQWIPERLLFEAQETDRLASLQKRIADSPRNHSLILLYLVAIDIAVAADCPLLLAAS